MPQKFAAAKIDVILKVKSNLFSSVDRIEEELGAGAKFAGEKFRAPLK